MKATTRRPAASAILWDIDGTLIDSEPLHFQSLQHALEHLGVAVDADLQSRTTGLSEQAVLAYCRRTFGIAIDDETWVGLRQSYYLARAATLRWRPGALAVVQYLAERGIAQAVVSNSGRPIVDANLRTLSLHDGGLVSISRDDVTSGKPHPEPYLTAATRLGRPPSACVVVEDSLAGVRSGVAAGMQVLYWPESAPASIPASPVRYVRTADDLHTRLRELF